MTRPVSWTVAALWVAAAGAAVADPAPAKAPPSAEARPAGPKPEARPLGDALVELERERAALEAAAKEFHYRCVQVLGHAVYCHCVNGRRPAAVDFDAFVLFTSRTRTELGYDRLGADEQKLVDDTRLARIECVAAMGW